MKRGTILSRFMAAGAFSIAIVGSALGQMSPPPWWGTNDGFTTSQQWTFDTPSVGAPEWSVNPFGSPNAVTNGTWLPSFGNSNGLVDIRDGQLIDFFIPNRPNPAMIKNCWWQISYYGGGTPFQTLTSPGSNVTNFQSLEIISDPSDGKITWTVSFDIIPQPEWERIILSTEVGSSNTLTVDSFAFGTHCVPEPASLAAIGIGLAGAALRRRRR